MKVRFLIFFFIYAFDLSYTFFYLVSQTLPKTKLLSDQPDFCWSACVGFAVRVILTTQFSTNLVIWLLYFHLCCPIHRIAYYTCDVSENFLFCCSKDSFCLGSICLCVTSICHYRSQACFVLFVSYSLTPLFPCWCVCCWTSRLFMPLVFSSFLSLGLSFPLWGFFHLWFQRCLCLLTR